MLCGTGPVFAQEPSAPPENTTVKLTYYLDTRDYNTLNILGSSQGLPLGFSVWGFIDVHSNQKVSGERFDLSRYFMEYRLNRAFDPKWFHGARGLGFQAEYNDFNGSRNAVARLGLTYKHGLERIKNYKGWLRWRVHPYETDGTGWQASVIYSLPITERIGISGFADLNINNGQTNRWIVEPQINIKLNHRFSAVIEYRFNGFEEANSRLSGSGAAFGLGMEL